MNPALCCKLWVDVHADFQSAGWLSSVSLDRMTLPQQIICDRDARIVVRRPAFRAERALRPTVNP